MKKLFATLFLASALCLTGCGASESSGSVHSRLTSSGYSATIYDAEGTKTRYSDYFNFSNVSIVDSVVALKDEESTTNRDFFIAIFFSNIKQASTFLDANYIDLVRTAEKNVGTSMEATAGAKNNAVFCASTVSASIAF